MVISPSKGKQVGWFTILAVFFWALGAGTLVSAEGDGSGTVGPVRVQTIQLEAGWNAVYLEVEPLLKTPGALFSGTPIDIAAAYFRPVTPMEFINSPNEILPDRKGWSVWYSPERDDALLSNLHVVEAHQAYLIHSTEDYLWSLEGTPFHGSSRWHPHAFSLVGFPVDGDARPTLANFFAGAGAHAPLRMYRLEGGLWTLVDNPAQTMMEPGAAYWIYSKGASRFRGPLSVNFFNSSAGGLVFSENTESRRVEFANVSVFPQQLTISIEPGPNGPLPMAYLVRMLNTTEKAMDLISIPFAGVIDLGPLEPGESFAMDLEVMQEEVTLPFMGSTLSITSDAGVRKEIPLISVRRDLINR